MLSWAALALSQKKRVAMKVICIKGVKPGEEKTHCGTGKPLVQPDEAITEGEPYNVVLTKVTDGHKYYFLAERPATIACGYERFLPCSDIDETARLEAWQTEQGERLDKEMAEIVEGLNA